MCNTPHPTLQPANSRAADYAHVWHPYTRRSTLRDEALPIIVRGEGCHLIDAEGRRYLDAIASWWCVNLGHGRPEIITAITRQAERLQHSILGNLTHPGAIDLAGRLARLMPTPDRHVLFASDGSSAVEQAVKIAIQYRANIGQLQRTRLACLEGAYHGDTLGAMALGYLESFHKPYRSHLFPAITLPFPDCRPDCGNACGADCFTPARNILDEHADSLTAVIVEPLLQGASGMRIYGEAWLRALARWCREHDVMLILDEIATGMGRTGEWFAFNRAGIDPDIVCVGKGLSGGYLPISATIVRDAMYDTFSDLPVDHTLQHGHTFCGNPLAVAASCAALELYENGVIAGVSAKGDRLAKALEPARNHPRVANVRSLGLMTALTLKAETTNSTGTTLPHRIRRRLVASGVLLRPLGSVVYVMPPLVIADDDMQQLADGIISALDTP
ncbi:MAG TPA: adenosylmethionine--8-amino-7-oxononanoate transaminase [Kiritimatiellia bacterium]|nr:adenosylmethionine--8-amino-7-oxononanoate transaminase [Kiritimatiellia bacterium]HMO97913.1 adenosylmethionine--8-amino-7-oxononanoate transaminase [Kiritimatiellia bacterium]HMP95568.1 adenosylmethionine--8-amino-7-oxononanoate transaminase [Kiritimatiellia bacterium]